MILLSCLQLSKYRKREKEEKKGESIKREKEGKGIKKKEKSIVAVASVFCKQNGN